MATTYLASKPRYEILDGLRGVAAMIVVAFHLLKHIPKDPFFRRSITVTWLSISFRAVRIRHRLCL